MSRILCDKCGSLSSIPRISPPTPPDRWPPGTSVSHVAVASVFHKVTIEMSGASDTAQATEKIITWAVLNGTEGVPSFSASTIADIPHQRRAQVMADRMPASGVSQCGGLHCLLGSVERKKKGKRNASKLQQRFYIGAACELLALARAPSFPQAWFLRSAFCLTNTSQRPVLPSGSAVSEWGIGHLGLLTKDEVAWLAFKQPR